METMKRLLSIMLSMVLCLPMAACNRETPPAEEPGDGQQDPPPPSYTLVVENTADKYSDTDGTLLASYDYDILKMQVPDTASEEARTKAEAFNAVMDALLENQLGDELREWAVYDDQIKVSKVYYTDELDVTYTQVGSYISVVYSSYSYTGGVHPNSYCFSYIFNMDRGAYMDPAEIGEDPELVRATVTDLILDQIDNGLEEEVRVGLFENYPSVVAQWNDRCVALGEESMTVTFSTYDIGPYAMGALSFEIPYQELRDALGDSGWAQLGQA